MASFLGISGRKAPAETADATKINLDQLKTLIEFFPIGKKLTYCPEFKREIIFDTLVLGYCVNGGFIYSMEAIEPDAGGYPAIFRIGESKEKLPVSRLELFQILVPDTTDLEMKLDYYRRALIGRGRQFVRGNTISLTSRGATRGVSTLDTHVAKQVVLPQGPYANTRMILLSPELRTLTVTDQRKKARARTSVPVRLFVLKTKSSGSYVIADISDDAVAVAAGDRDPAAPAMNPGDEVILDINLGKAKGRHIIKGSVFRHSSENCIIHMEGPFRDGRLSSFTPLDLLELKAGLLNYDAGR